MDKKNESRKAVRAARLRKQRARRAILTLCLMLAVAVVSVGGTIAWLTATTTPVVNTFTPSDINITLTETTGSEYKMVPGNTISKNPYVTVKANSEASWVFVKIEKSTDKAFDTYMTYAIADGWIALDVEEGVYYRTVDATTADTTFAVLAGDQVTVKTEVTKAMMNELTANNYPKLTITAYAIQQASFNTAAAAWAEVSGSNN